MLITKHTVGGMRLDLKALSVVTIIKKYGEKPAHGDKPTTSLLHQTGERAIIV